VAAASLAGLLALLGAVALIAIPREAAPGTRIWSGAANAGAVAASELLPAYLEAPTIAASYVPAARAVSVRYVLVGSAAQAAVAGVMLRAVSRAAWGDPPGGESVVLVLDSAAAAHDAATRIDVARDACQLVSVPCRVDAVGLWSVSVPSN
jgi:hypothetical protein